MKYLILQSKSFEFAKLIVFTCRDIVKTSKEYTLSKQLLRSGTSIGANIEEAIGGYTNKDFLAKLSIAYKEARETKYWIRLMQETGILHTDCKALLDQLEELLKILASILIRAKKK